MTPMLLALAAFTEARPYEGDLTFQEFEKRKYETFCNLHSFTGRYQILSSKADGSAVRQDIVFQFGPKGRQMLVLVNGKPISEIGWNDAQIWRVSYTDKTYSVNVVPNALARQKFKMIEAPKNQFSFSATDAGIRFGFDPEPPIDGPIRDKLLDRDGERYILRMSDDATDANAIVTQWCDVGTYIVRQFEIKVKVKGVQQVLVRGVLVDDDERALVPSTVGELPVSTLQEFKRLGSS